MSEEVEKTAAEIDAASEPGQKVAEVVHEIDANSEKVLDELTSIEREIAIMHDATEDTSQGDDCLIIESSFSLDKSDDRGPQGQHAERAEDEDGSSQSNGIKQLEKKNGNTTVNSVAELSDAPDSTGSPDGNKVIVSDQLEHEDLLAVLKGTDDKDHIETGVTIEGEGEFQIVDIIDNDDIIETDPLAKDTPKKEPLSREEEHKLALEQWHSLKSKSRRRKQDIKSITQPADLVTSLVSDWSDGDEVNAEEPVAMAPSSKKKSIMSTVQVKVAQLPKPVQEGAKVLVVKEKDKPTTPPTANATKKAVQTTAPTQASANQPKKLINSTSPEKKAPVIPPPSPFKRTRIIKRKIIWDPDAPETQFSYAKLVKPTTPTPVKKETTKKDRATPVPKKKEEPIASSTPTPASAPAKRQLTETPTTVNGNKKKKFSEVDRLLGDEGAVNMLNSLEGERTKRSSEGDASRAANRKVAAVTKSSTPERSQTPQKKEVVQPKRRTPKPKASSSWDYVYKQQNDDSMIIRRRSNSSYSSNASINRLSVDTPSSNNKSSRSTPRTTPKTPQASPINSTPTSGAKAQDSSNQFEFAKPENKNKTKKMKSPIILINPLSVDLKKSAAKRNVKSPLGTDNGSNDGNEFEDVTITKIGGVRQVTFSTQRSKLGNTFTAQLLNELTQVLDDLNDDSECNVVLMLSEGPNFCQGIDFTDMALGALEKRKNAAILMARAVKNFLIALANFRKPLVAGVSGSNSGLGVTMLPLFDVVIGSDKGVYETPYARIGQIPEGYFIFSESPKVRSTFKTKLLWLAEKLHSTESALSGLVNKLTSATKVNEEALICAKKIASLSTEAYTAMKKRSIEHSLPNVVTSLEEEEEILVKQWCSAPCVENFKHFIHKGQW